MKRDVQPIERLKNIGSTVARRLNEIGVRTRDDLETIGPVKAYLHIRARHPEKTLPVCYYLYSLEGALRDQHWDAIGDDVKQSLLNQISQPAAGRPMADAQ